jgi:hypothetical protein
VLLRDVPLRIKRRGVEMRLIIEGPPASPTTPDPVLLKEIRRAHHCFEALVSGQVGSVAELATLEGISDRYVSSVLPLAFLAPDIVEADRRGTPAFRPDRPSADQGRGPPDRLVGTEAAEGDGAVDLALLPDAVTAGSVAGIAFVLGRFRSYPRPTFADT